MSLCCECARDDFLRDCIRKLGAIGPCGICGLSTNIALDTQKLAGLVKGAIESRFETDYDLYPGHEGHELHTLVANALLYDGPLCDQIVNLLVVEDSGDDDQFFSEGQTYWPIAVPEDAFDSWDDIEHDFKHSRRFFNRRATIFFADLVAEAEASMRKTLYGSTQAPFLAKIPAGKILYRARLARSEQERDEILAVPGASLGAAPPEKAAEGRMSSAGISLFYSAENIETAIAEVRPSIGEYVVIGRFVTTEDLRIFDFSGLDLPLDYPAVSYFDPNGHAKESMRQTLRYLHRELARPVSPSGSGKYLITQALAEYLAYVHDKPFDGLKFGSSQRQDGKNVVLFPGPIWNQGKYVSRHRVFPVKWTGDAPVVRQIFGIAYDTSPPPRGRGSTK